MMDNLKKICEQGRSLESADYRTGLLDRDVWFGNVCLCHDCGGSINGWLNKEEYAPVARRAWLGLCNYINDKNDLTEVCVGTGKEKTVNNIIWIVPASPVIIMDRHR